MDFVMFKGERKLADLVERAFGELKVADRRRAEAALVRANPQLAKLEELTPGSLVVVPRVPGIERRGKREVQAPASAVAGELSNTLKAYLRGLRGSAEVEAERLSALEQLVRSGSLQEELSDVADAQPYLDQAERAVGLRGEALEQRRAALERLAEAERELAELEERAR